VNQDCQLIRDRSRKRSGSVIPFIGNSVGGRKSSRNDGNISDDSTSKEGKSTPRARPWIYLKDGLPELERAASMRLKAKAERTPLATTLLASNLRNPNTIIVVP
jgi:hypothetical protein